MTYPALPAPRIEYDRDGSRLYWISGSTVTEVSAGEISAMANENEDDIGNQGSRGTLLFVVPEKRDISHIFLALAQSSTDSVVVSWSDNTTTGLDGTWTQSTAALPDSSSASKYRDEIQAVSGIAGATAVKMVLSNNQYGESIKALHLYGKASTGQLIHRLRLWHPTTDAPLEDYPAFLDWGNIPQGSNATKQFRIKNDSPNLNAAGVTCFMQALYDSSPTQVGQHTLSLDDSTYVNAATPGVTVGTINAQAISAIIYLKRTTTASAQLGLWRQRLVAGAATWS